jgi:hypothetical protein
MVSTRGFVAFGVLGAWLAVLPAHADGVCEKGTRDTTAAERATMTNALETAKAALPTAPDGWIVGGYEEISVVQSICMDTEATPWSYNISRTYNRADDLAEREQLQADAGAALRASMAERQPRIEALMAKLPELGAALAEAGQKGDQARVDAINKEMEQLQAQMEAIMNEGPSPEQLAAIGGLLEQDRTMSISVQVNASWADTDGMQSAQAPAGASVAFRGEETSDGVPTAEATVLFGSWQPRAEGGGMQLARRGTVSSAAAHGVIMTVRADPARLDSLLARIDFGAIGALVR